MQHIFIDCYSGRGLTFMICKLHDCDHRRMNRIRCRSLWYEIMMTWIVWIWGIYIGWNKCWNSFLNILESMVAVFKKLICFVENLCNGAEVIGFMENASEFLCMILKVAPLLRKKIGFSDSMLILGIFLLYLLQRCLIVQLSKMNLFINQIIFPISS